MASLPAPWIEHRETAERIGHAVEDAISQVVGARLDLGIATSCDPDVMVANRSYPLRAIVVHFHRPLRDVMIFVSSLREDFLRPLVSAAATATLASFDVAEGADRHGHLGQFTIDDAVEFTDLETALEECDGLYLEAVYGLDLPTGELQMVLGSGLVESASYLAKGTPDPYAIEPACEPAMSSDCDELVLSDSLGIDADVQRYELSGGTVVDGLVPVGLDVAAVSGIPASPLDAFDAQLAADQARSRLDAPAPAGPAPATCVTEQPSDAEAKTLRWTQLLSGVEVELSAELGRADLSLRDITSLASESVLTLDQLVDDPVSVFVNGTRYATARLVVVDGEYGIEILEVVDQSSFTTTLAA